jgi:hypothetical protein
MLIPIPLSRPLVDDEIKGAVPAAIDSRLALAERAYSRRRA